MRGWVVVLYLSSDCDAFPGAPCLQSVLTRKDGTPFQTNEEAKEEAGTWPDWCRPHVMMLTPTTHGATT